MGTQANSKPPLVSPDPNQLYTIADVETALQEQAQQDAQISLDEIQFPGLSIRGVLGGLPVAEKNQEYFAVIFEAVDTSPEIIDQTQFKITYLCDSELNVSKPSQDTISLINTVQNFERQKKARVRVDQGTVLNNQLGGLHQITAVGSLEPICGTQIGQGPLSYVTTMSFKQEGQLGPVLSIPIEGYYQWLNKTTGFQNKGIVYEKIGTTNQGDSWTIQNDPEEGKLQTFYDSVQAEPSGAAVQAADSQSIFANDYFDQIKILTGSIEGNSRVKVKVGAMVNIVTSSVADMIMGILGAYNTDNIQYQNGAPVTLNVYKESSEGFESRELLGSQTVVLPTINNSLVFTQNGIMPIAGSESTYALSGPTRTLLAWYYFNGFLDEEDLETNIPGFSWQLDGSARAIVVETNYFDVSEDDTVYGELVFPEEVPSPTIAGAQNLDNAQGNGNLNLPTPGGIFSIPLSVSFTESLFEHRNTAAVRTYQYFAGSEIMTQETPEAGAGFNNNITGVTASYFNYTDGEPTASVYNYTGSYWVGYNNFSGSEEGIGSFVTASTPLTNFYGGDFIQVNPGTEKYNILNADGSPTSSLFLNGLDQTDKLTWNNFGFNPIRLPFIPQAGDFIRFEYNKQKVALITNVNSSGNALKLKLDKQISESTILDNFIIYRIVENGQYIILDVKKNIEAGVDQPFSGIISAEFPSENLDKNSDELLFQLKQAGIISERDFLK